MEYLDHSLVTSPSMIASNIVTSTWPVVSQLQYRIFSEHVGDTVTLCVAFLGTDTWQKVVTDINIMESSIDWTLGGQPYHISIYSGIFTSLFSNNAAPVKEIMSVLERQMRKHPNGPAGKWRLRLGGYSLGSTQILYFLCWYMSDSIQAMYPTVTSKHFKSIECFLVASVVGTRCDELSAYIEAMRRRHHAFSLFSILQTMDIANRAVMNLLLTRHAMSEHIIIEAENNCVALYRIPSVLIGRGIVLKSMFVVSFLNPKSFAYLANVIGLSTKNHYLVEYIAAIKSFVAKHGRKCAPRT